MPKLFQGMMSFYTLVVKWWKLYSLLQQRSIHWYAAIEIIIQ